MGKLTVEQERLVAALQDNVEVSAEVPAEVPVAELPAGQSRLAGALTELATEQRRLVAALQNEAIP